MDTDLSGSVRIAVLIDADNTSPTYAEAMLDELAKYGTPTIRRAYGDFSSPRLGGWTKELNARAIRAMHANAFTTGKNSTDSALIIDAMDLLYAGNVEAFAIVSSDSDFTSLATRLRESGKTVYGLGRQRTPMSLQNACDKFIFLEVLGAGEAEGSTAADHAPDREPGREPGQEEAEPTPKLNLQSVLVRAVNATVADDGWTRLSAIGSHLNRSHPSFDPRTFGHAKLSSLVAAQAFLETRADGATTLVRLKGQGAPAKKAAAQQPPAQKTPAKKAAAKKSAAKKSPEEESAEKESADEAAAAPKAAVKAVVKKTTRQRTRKAVSQAAEPQA